MDRTRLTDYLWNLYLRFSQNKEKSQLDKRSAKKESKDLADTTSQDLPYSQRYFLIKTLYSGIKSTFKYLMLPALSEKKNEQKQFMNRNTLFSHVHIFKFSANDFHEE